MSYQEWGDIRKLARSMMDDVWDPSGTPTYAATLAAVELALSEAFECGHEAAMEEIARGGL